MTAPLHPLFPPRAFIRRAFPHAVRACPCLCLLPAALKSPTAGSAAACAQGLVIRPGPPWWVSSIHRSSLTRAWGEVGCSLGRGWELGAGMGLSQGQPWSQGAGRPDPVKDAAVLAVRQAQRRDHGAGNSCPETALIPGSLQQAIQLHQPWMPRALLQKLYFLPVLPVGGGPLHSRSG